MINLNSLEDINFTLFFTSYIGFLLSGKKQVLNHCKNFLSKKLNSSLCREGKSLIVKGGLGEEITIFPQYIKVDFDNYECRLEISGIKIDENGNPEHVSIINNIEDIKE